MSDQSGDLIQSVKAGDLPSLARLLTVLERQGSDSFQRYPGLLQPDKLAFRLGITGPPGAGKSTLISQLIARFRAQGLKVGVLAVDPSSPFSKGAVLGDRIRYAQHFTDPGVFIRSLASRGSLGGLSAATYLMVRAFDLAGFDIVLLETVGVGQTELEIMNVADFVSVVLVPESGDSIQGMKAGLLEIADLFIVNKSDRPGAAAFLNELQSALQLGHPPSASGDGSLRETKILPTAAINGSGLDEVVALVESVRAQSSDGGDWRVRRASVGRLRAEAAALLRARAERTISAQTALIESPQHLLNLFIESHNE